MKYLLDTNILIYSIKKNTKAIQFATDVDSVISVLTRLELQIGSHKEDEAEVMNILQHMPALPITEQIADLAAKLITKDPSLKRKYPDVLIAATCIHHGFELITANVKDFKDIPGLSIVSFERE